VPVTSWADSSASVRSSTVSARPVQRGLVEKILDPNRNISKAFQNYTIKLKDGTVKSGLFRRDEGQSKVFADITGKNSR